MKLFRKVQQVVCDYRESRQKNIVASFSMACHHPHKQSPWCPEKTPAFRPAQILLSRLSDYTDPMLMSFFRMMGYEDKDIKPARGELLKLWQESVVFSSPVRNREVKKFPHLYGISRGMLCGNCQTVGPHIKMCICSGVYYCNKECQIANWSAHKKVHGKFLQNQSTVVKVVKATGNSRSTQAAVVDFRENPVKKSWSCRACWNGLSSCRSSKNV